jgi:hypothetical protein
MASEPPVVVYDACVLYPFHLRNLLVELAVEGFVAARWTDTIHDEWIRSLAKRAGLPRARFIKTRDLMKAVLPEADVRGSESIVPSLTLPDANDRHVLAAAIAARASIILTWNVKHFPASALAPHGVIAKDPDTFLTALAGEDIDAIRDVVESARQNLTLTEPSHTAYLAALRRQGLKAFVAKLKT